MKKFIIFVLSALLALPGFARIITVSGKVTYRVDDKPVQFGAVYEVIDGDLSEMPIGNIDNSGNYSIDVDSETRLCFQGLFQKKFEDVNGRLEINVQVDTLTEGSGIQLDVVEIEGKGGKKTLSAAPVDLRIEGDSLVWNTSKAFTVHKHQFGASKRLVIQPIVCDATTNEAFYMQHIVVDGWRYADTQERMYDWHAERDTLNPAVSIKEDDCGKEFHIGLKGAFYIGRHKSHLYKFVSLLSIEDYNRIIDGDSFEQATGTKNPLHFLNYDLEPRLLDQDRFIPVAERKRRPSSGQMNLNFLVGKSDLDLTLGSNAEELEKLLDEFRTINNSRGMTLQEFAIFGYASPEGGYAANKRLAANRMNSAMNYITNQINVISPDLLRYVKPSADSDVAEWKEVADALRTDSLFEEADQVMAIIDRYQTVDNQSVAMKRLPFYNDLIKDKYLPRLRRVDYTIVTEIFRVLTDEEIAELYKSDPAGLTEYEFYRYYNACTGDEREEALHKAVEVHPGFFAAATDLSALMLKKGENPKEILLPFFANTPKWRTECPEAMRYNLALCHMKDEEYAAADSLLASVKDTELTHKAIIYCMALNGHFTEVTDEISKDSLLNAVLMKLALNHNADAAAMAIHMGNSAVEEYVKGIALNRVENWEAAAHFEQAFELDPSLKEHAKIDGDILNLIENGDISLD